MITHLLLAAILTADPTDAGIPPPSVESLYTACPDAPLAEVVDGGFFVPAQRARRQSCQLAACEDFAAPRLTTQPVGEASPGIVIALTGGGVAVAVLVGVLSFFAGKASK